MQENIIDILDRHTPYYFVKAFDEGSYILLYLPYQPFKEVGCDYAVISGNYVAYVRLNALRNKLLAALSEYQAQPFNGNLKKLFVDSHCAVYLKNNLVAIPPYGSRISLHAIRINTKLDDKVLAEDRLEMLCASCSLCVDSCPSYALDGECFKPNLCLRKCMDEYDTSDVDFTLLNGGILGCDVCQNNCPYNAEVGYSDMPDDLKDMVRIQNLLQLCQNGRGALAPLAEYIGTNYIKPLRLQFFALNAIRDKKNAYLALDYLNSQHQLLVNAAKKVLLRHNIPF